MIKNIQYIRLHEVLSRVLRHPIFKSSGLNVALEDAVQYVIDFIHIMGMPEMFQDKEIDVQITKFQGELPCDLVSINQVKNLQTGICMRSMTDTFMPEDFNNCGCYREEDTFKVQNRTIITSFKEGNIKISYKSIPVDEDGFPLLIDNPTFLKALELYIKLQLFTILYDLGKIQPGVMQNVQQDYAWAAGQCQSEFTIPSYSEMESISRNWTQMVQSVTDFDTGFKKYGNRNYIRRH